MASRGGESQTTETPLKSVVSRAGALPIVLFLVPDHPRRILPEW